jgi:hypothetical protein
MVTRKLTINPELYDEAIRVNQADNAQVNTGDLLSVVKPV